jgi:hypothetical protein
MDESLFGLDPGHWVSASGPPPLQLHSLEKHLMEDLWD